MAIRQPLSTGTSESSIIFYNGGHNHDGISSALIDTAKYSIYDFTTNFTGTDSRQITQNNNFRDFTNVISKIVKESVLGPSGITLSPNQVRAENISAGAVGASELAANIVLVNNFIASGNYVAGVSGWAISSNGTAEFANTSIRGTVVAGSLYINAYNQWYANGTIYVGNPEFDEPGFAYSAALGMSVYGKITATAGRIGAFEIQDSTLKTGDQFIGWISLGPVANAAYGGVPAGEVEISTRDPDDNHQVTASMRGEYFMVMDDDNNARISYMHKDGFATNGIVVCDSVQTPSVVYPYSPNQIAFSWDGSVLYAVVDGTAFPLLTGEGAPAVSPEVSPVVSPGVSPEVVSPGVSPGGGCVECSTPGTADCCPPATCGSFKDGYICLDLSNM